MAKPLVGLVSDRCGEAIADGPGPLTCGRRILHLAIRIGRPQDR